MTRAELCATHNSQVRHDMLRAVEGTGDDGGGVMRAGAEVKPVRPNAAAGCGTGDARNISGAGTKKGRAPKGPASGITSV